MTWSLLGAAGAAALGVRIAHSRTRRFLHPVGRSFAGELEVWGAPAGRTGARLLDRPGRHAVTLRISKGGGTPAGWPDVLGLAVRVPGTPPDGPSDLLLSTAGSGHLARHLPVPRRSFDTRYGSILAYRTGGADGRKVYLAAMPDPDGAPLGDTLDTVAAAARSGGGRLLLAVVDDDVQPFGRLTLGAELSAQDDADLAFDPVRHTAADLHPTGLIHASRAAAYRWSQRWRRTRPAAPDGSAVRRTVTPSTPP